MPDLRLPSGRVSILLVFVFFGFGWVLGDVSGSRSTGALAAAVGPPHYKLVLAPAAQGPAETSSTASVPPTLPETPTPAAGGHESAEPASEAPTVKKTSTSTSTSAAQSSQGSEAGAEGSEKGGGGSHSSSGLPPVKHVFLIVLANEPYASVFGPASQAHYLAGTLEKRGELLVRYYAVSHDELANGIALLSGQGPTPETAANCPSFADIQPANVGADQQVLGHGCVYPRSTQTLPGQLSAKHLTWKAYMDGMTAPGGSPASCVHPAIGAADATVGPAPAPSATAGPNQAAPANPAAPGAFYTTFRNPFVYFHGILDAPACAADDVGLKRLASDLGSAAHTPSFAYIAPSLCHDGGQTPCVPGQPAGPAAADSFLRQVVPEILASKAYKEGGLLAITVDQAPASGIDADSSSCCGQPAFPGLPAPPPLPGGGHLPPPGGGQVGALLLSPFVKAGTLNQTPYNHFALLRSIEDLFGLPHLGYAAQKGVKSFDASVFSASPGG